MQRDNESFKVTFIEETTSDNPFLLTSAKDLKAEEQLLVGPVTNWSTYTSKLCATCKKQIENFNLQTTPKVMRHVDWYLS